jgi:hypothetical protein
MARLFEVFKGSIAMFTLVFKKALLFALIACASGSVVAKSNMLPDSDSLEFDGLQAVDNKVLDKMRGGFVSPEGVKFDLGVGKAIYVDGQLQLQNSFATNNVHFNEQAISTSNLDSVTSDVKTIIQNNIDNKTIQSFTVLDVNVKNFGGFIESMRTIQDIRAGQNIQALR